MNCNVGTAGQNGGLNFFDKHTLATNGVQWNIFLPVASRVDKN
jgi:hypothetical protein